MKQKLKTVYVPTEKDYDLYRCFWDSKEGRYFKLENLNKVELITFTPEEYNQHIQDVIEDALKTAADYADTEFCGNMYDPEDNTQCINRGSITNTFEETFKKYKL